MNNMHPSGAPPGGNNSHASNGMGVNPTAPGPAQSNPGSMFPIDPNTASLMMNPHAAAAMAAAAAAAVQQMAQQQQGNPSSTMIQNGGNPVAQSPGHLHHHHVSHVPATAPTPAVAPHHPAPVPSGTTQQVGSNNAAVQQSSLAMMAALFNGLGGAAAAAADQSKGGHPQPMQVVAAPTPMPYPMAAAQSPAPPSSVAASPASSQLGAIPNNPAAVAAAAAQVVAAHSANASTSTGSGTMTNALLANIKSWKLEQLESHVQLLRDTNQPIPQPVAMLLAEARRKEEKRTAKRVANRKSACTSRARKKALVEEMTKTNARLRRQALILALLPDLVIAITIDGEITFCSAQVERVLRHSNQELVGSNLSDILVPASREALRHLILELVAAERVAASSTGDVSPSDDVASAGEPARAAKKPARENDGSAQSSSGGDVSSGGPVVVSDQSFPPSVVKVENRRKQNSTGGGDSDLSTSNGGKTALPVSSITNHSLSRSTTNSSLGNQSDEAVQAAALAAKDSGEDNQLKSDVSPPCADKPQAQTSSDDSLSSASDVKNLRKANEALSRNVRWHNEKLLSKSKAGSSKSAHKDDVTGASVTANNADARLSSLQHHPAEEPAAKKAKSSRYESLEEQSSSSSSDSLLAGVEEKRKRRNKDGIENSSEDSGYRESNDSQSSSREDSTSSSSNDKDRPKPLAPTCNVCLIRDDLTTIWCEVTSSIRSRPLKEGFDAGASAGAQNQPSIVKAGAPSELPPSSQNPSSDDVSPQPEVIKELLLCLRPIRDGEEKVDESFRFVPAATRMEVEVTSGNRASSANSESKVMDSGISSTKLNESMTNVSSKSSRPPKKRPIKKHDKVSKVSSDSSSNPAKKSRISSDTEKSVVESLILMSHNSPTK